MTAHTCEFEPGTLVYIELRGEIGLFPAIVTFAFTSDYDTGLYYVLRPTRAVRDKDGRAWETYEVRSRWQISTDARGPLPYTDRLMTMRMEPVPPRKFEGSYVNYNALDPAADAALALDAEDDVFDDEDFDEDDYQDDDEPSSGGGTHS